MSRQTKAQRLAVALAERVMADPKASPADLAKAAQALQRATAKPRGPYKKTVPPSEEASIDSLVQEIETEAKKTPLEGPANSIGSPQSASVRLDNLQDPPEAPEAGKSLLQPPAPEPPRHWDPDRCVRCGLVLCGCARAQKTWEGDPNVAGNSLQAVHGSPIDFQRSVEIWRQQADQEATERAELIREIQDQARKNSF